MGGEFADDFDVPFGVVEEGGVEFGELVAQATVLVEATGVDDLGGGLAGLGISEIHRNAAHHHGEGDEIIVREFDLACLQEGGCFRKRERFQSDGRGGDPIVEATLVVDHLLDDPRSG